MKKLQVLLSMSILVNLAAANDYNPLSGYSSQWNHEFYQKANTASDVNFLSKEEKEFVFVINLARMNPWLFCNSVLLPYAQKNGYTTPIMLTIEKMKGNQKYGMLNVDAFFANSAKKWLQTKSIANFKGKGYPDSLFLNDPMMKNSVLLFGDSKDPVQLLCSMIADAESGYHSIRRHLTCEYNSVGLHMQFFGNKTIISMMFSDMSSVAFRDPKGYELSLKYGKGLEKMEVSLFDNRDDSILNYYHHLPVFSTKNGTLLSEVAFKRVKDSLNKKCVSYSDSGRTIYFGNEPAVSISDQLYCNYRPGDFYRSYWSGSRKAIDQPHAFNFYCFKRSLVPNGSGEYVITFQQMVNIPMDPMFKANQVGIEIPSVNLWKIDSFARQTNVAPLKSLAHKLTDRYTKREEKVRSLFAWMQSHLRYDYEGLRNGNMVYNAEDALVKGVAVCAGYADLFHKFCQELNIPSEYVTGYADNGTVGGHAWNAVMINDKWYLIDVTWGERYYLASPEYFIKDHFPSEHKWTLLQNYFPWETFMKGRVMDK